MRDYASLFNLLLSDLSIETMDNPDRYFSDHGTDSVARRALADSFYKKLCPEGNTREADAKALIKFKAINASISTEPFDFKASNEAESCFFDYFLDEVDRVTENSPFGQNFDYEFIRDHMGVGPGSAQKADSSTMISKLFNSPLSYTHDDLIRLYRSALATSGLWAEAEMQRFQEYGNTKVEGGKLFFAPKNREISRTCCTEATLNMLIQKAIGAFLEQGLEKYFDVSLSTQPDLNRELARKGSVDWESKDSYSTIDLISASDCISLALVKKTIRNPVLRNAIMVSRCEFAILPDGERVKLNMVSTMGNGFTFPLQTLYFACAIKAVYTLMGIPMSVNGSKNFGVFGDDIVVVKTAYVFLCQMLNKLGFQVNTSKSYSTGPFRESCGHDYYRGHNVRGVYVKSLETPQEVISVINRLNRWSAFHGIQLPSVIALLLQWCPRILVPPSENDDAGIHVPFEQTKPKLTSTYWFKYRAFKRKNRRVDIVESDDESKVDLGLACGFLSGIYRRRDFLYTLSDDNILSNPWEGANGVSVSLRDEVGARARYKVVTKSIPYWDWLPITKNGSSSEQDGPWRLGSAESYNAWKNIITAGLDSCPGRAGNKI